MKQYSPYDLTDPRKGFKGLADYERRKQKESTERAKENSRGRSPYDASVKRW